LAIDPSDGKTLYAATWERIRRPWRITEFGKGSGLFKSTDAGTTWRRLGNGFPTGEFLGRIGLDISLSNPQVLYAVVDNHNDMTDPRALQRAKRQSGTLKLIVGAEVYRSDNKGESWQKVNTADITDLYHIPFNYGFYFGQIRIAPDNENEVFLLGAPLFHSKDGGKTYETVSYPALYADHHAMWIDPTQPDHILDGNDGGLNISYDRGRTWEDIEMPLGQCYSVVVDMDDPYHVYTALQDGMSWYGSSVSVPGETEAWKRFPGGERSDLAFDFSDYQTLYSTASLRRIDRKTWSAINIEPRGIAGELRKNWHPPLIVSPHNPQILYFGTQMLLMSLDRGDRWRAISPDLASPGPQERGTVHVQYGTITSISESPFKFGLIYAGTDDGNIHVTHNGGMTWEKITNRLPSKRWVSCLTASRYQEGTVFLTLNGLRNDDFRAYIYRSGDFGKTWESIVGNLPCGPVNVIREDPLNKNVLYVGTDIGLYVSCNRGQTWASLGTNLPTAIINDLVVHPRDHQLVIGTHGHSIYVLDVNPVQEWDEALREKALHLFSLNAVPPGVEAIPGFTAPIYYYIRQAQSVRLEISRESGEVIKAIETVGRPGINSIYWDLRAENRGRAVPPGTYRINISAGKNSASGNLEIRGTSFRFP